MKYLLEPVFQAFEKQFSIGITLHDFGHLLYKGENLLVHPSRFSHRQSFPLQCGRKPRTYCVAHCMDDVNRRLLEKHGAYTLKRCKYGYLEVIYSYFQFDKCSIVFYAGLFERPVPREKVDALRLLLPVFALGVIGQAAMIRRTHENSLDVQDRISAYISAHFMERISTADLAKKLCLSISRTCHLVQERFQCSFFDLLTAERLHHAKLYLKDSDMRISMIAGFCGFYSVEHFNRTFKKMLAAAPTTYRKLHKKNDPPREKSG